MRLSCNNCSWWGDEKHLSEGNCPVCGNSSLEMSIADKAKEHVEHMRSKGDCPFEFIERIGKELGLGDIIQPTYSGYDVATMVAIIAQYSDNRRNM